MARPADLYTLFGAALAPDPRKAAICEQGQSITYETLAEHVTELADALETAGVEPGDFVGVYAKPGGELVATLLALTKLGAVFVPLDLAYPRQRLLFMIHDAKLSHLIMDRPDADLEAQAECPVLQLADLQAPHTRAPSERAREAKPVRSPHDTCYVIYTSGTTGDPKGVLVSYVAVMNSILETAKVMDIQPSHRLLQLCPIGFDVFILEVGLVLTRGATLVFDDDKATPFDELLRREDIQHILCTPTSVADVDLRGTPLHSVMFGGELLPDAVVAKYLEHFRIVHAYGVTETAICATLAVCDGSVPVAMGSPLPNTSLTLVDADLCPVGPGEVGEIVLGGIGVANGYLDRPSLNAQRFIPDPVNPGQRRFRTGDLARRDAAGNLYFVGRNDRQIKYREYRLELYEVEALLLRHPNVTRAAALVVDEQLFAFVCSATTQLDLTELAAHLGHFMPAQLVPTLRRVFDMPLTTHKKTDYAQLERAISI